MEKKEREKEIVSLTEITLSVYAIFAEKMQGKDSWDGMKVLTALTTLILNSISQNVVYSYEKVLSDFMEMLLTSKKIQKYGKSNASGLA